MKLKMRASIGFAAVLLLLVLGGSTASAKEPQRGVYWPVRQYMSADSVLGRYYKHFITVYRGQYHHPDGAFRRFCQVLRTSDLLADQLRRVGMSPRQLQSILHDLERTNFARAERQAIRQNMLAVDLALETIEGAITQNHRAEFRREVLAEIPPITSTG